LRLNVYAEEVTGEVAMVKKTSEQGQDFYGVRVFLASPDVLHHTPEDDDRSAVTFWVPWTAAGGQDTGHIAQVFQEALRHLGNVPTGAQPATTKEGQ
jgi:hypothetical protein